MRIRRENPKETPSETFETLKRRLKKVDWRGYAARQLPWGEDEEEIKRHFGRAEPPNTRRRPEFVDL